MKNTQSETPEASSEDQFALGPGQGFVRILVTNVQNVGDYDKIKRTLITYGYSADSPIVARSAEGIIISIKTGASADILDGNLANGGDFENLPLGLIDLKIL